MSSLNTTSVNVSWDALIILDFPIDYYTVVYSQLPQQQDGREISAVFLPPTTSGVITGLRTDMYQFHVFATVTVEDTPLEGERSTPLNFTGPGKIILDSQQCIMLTINTIMSCITCVHIAGIVGSGCESTVGVVIGVIGILVGVVVGVSGLITAFIIVRHQK